MTQIVQMNADFYGIGRGGACPHPTCPHPIPATTALVQNPYPPSVPLIEEGRTSSNTLINKVNKGECNEDNSGIKGAFASHFVQSTSEDKGFMQFHRAGNPVRDFMLVENAKPHVTPHHVRDAITGLDGFIPAGCRWCGNIVLSTHIPSLRDAKICANPPNPRHPRSIFVSIPRSIRKS